MPVAPLAIHGSPTIRSAMAGSCPTFFRTYNLTNPPKRRNLVNICVLRAINWNAYHDINGRANLSQVKIMHHPDLQPLTAAQRAALPPLEELPTHPYAQLLPPAPPEQFELLVESIRRDPDHVALTLCEGMLLDGQERRKACLVTGADPMFEEYVGSDPAGYLLRTNVFRRQLTQSQITMAVVELRHSAPPGRPRNAEQRAGFSDDVHQFTSNELAIESGSSDRYVRKAKRVAREGLSHRVHSGELSINAANQLISDRAALDKKTTPGKSPKRKASTRQHTDEVREESMAEIVKVSRILGQSQEQTATLRDELTPLRALLQGVQDVTSTVGATDGCACPLLQELNLLLQRAQMLPPENGAQPVMGGPQALLGLPPKLPGFEVDGLTGDGKATIDANFPRSWDRLQAQ